MQREAVRKRKDPLSVEDQHALLNQINANNSILIDFARYFGNAKMVKNCELSEIDSRGFIMICNMQIDFRFGETRRAIVDAGNSSSIQCSSSQLE
jgi:hypothetical protein